MYAFKYVFMCVFVYCSENYHKATEAAVDMMRNMLAHTYVHIRTHMGAHTHRYAYTLSDTPTFHDLEIEGNIVSRNLKFGLAILS